MCIVCDMEKLNKLHSDASKQMVYALAEATHALIRASQAYRKDITNLNASGLLAANLAALDTELAKAIQNATSVLNGVDDKPADNAKLVEALQKQFPGAKVIVGSPDEVEAMMQKEIDAACGHKPN